MSPTPREKAVCRKVQAFKREVECDETVVKPDPGSKRQETVAKNLGSDLVFFQETVDDFQDFISTFRKNRRIINQNFLMIDEPDPQTAAIIDSSDVAQKLWTEVYECALGLREEIMLARTLGMVHSGEGLRRKLAECKEENRKLSRQIMEYRHQLNLK